MNLESSGGEKVTKNDGSSHRELDPNYRLYQTVYHHLTNKTEKISKTFDRSFILKDNDIFQIVAKLEQLCELHQVISSNTSIVIFHENDVKETFSSIERFKLYNKSNPNPVAAIQITKNFLLPDPVGEKPHPYTVVINLGSGLFSGGNRPRFIPPQILRILSVTRSQVEIKFVDYLIARYFVDAISEWVESLDENENSNLFMFFQKYSHHAHTISGLIGSTISLCIIWYLIPTFLNDGSIVDAGKFYVISFGYFYLLTKLFRFLGNEVENALDYSDSSSVIIINRGDEKKFTAQQGEIKKNKFKIFYSYIIQLILGIASSSIASMIK